MPPRKRATAETTKKATPAKRTRRSKKEEIEEEEEEEEEVAEEEENEEEVTLQQKLIAADNENKGTRVYTVDKAMPGARNYQVHGDYDCRLNQTNIGRDNIKFHVIQVLKRISDGKYFSWTRWGFVGQLPNGQNKLNGPYLDPDKAIKEFEKKFKDKTKNDWNDRENFIAQSGKYTLINTLGCGESTSSDST